MSDQLFNLTSVEVDIAVIGGGSAGMAAAVAAKRAGAEKVLVIERDDHLGGILEQCIHAGFGLEVYDEELTGPEYMQRHIDEVEAKGIETLLDTMVLELNEDLTLLVSNSIGLSCIKAGAVILAMGCRERTRDNILIAGSRPAGVLTAGTAQNLMNIRNRMVGREVVILGSGDIGLIMARRLTLEGAKVAAVYEIMDHPGGLPRNIRQCLDDFDIPLHLSHTVTEIKGGERLSSVEVAAVDETMQPVPGSEQEIPCDTLLLSVGLIPENELSRGAGAVLDPITGGPEVDGNYMTTVPGIFACGNVLHVHDVVDFVSQEGEIVGKAAAEFISTRSGSEDIPNDISVSPGPGIRYVLPHAIPAKGGILKLRVERPARDVQIVVSSDDNEVGRKRFPRVNPSEMIQFDLKIPTFRKPSDLTVRLEKLYHEVSP